MTITNASVSKRLMLFFLIFAGLYIAKPFLMPLCIAGILATLFLPFSNWMEKHKVPRIIAVLICYLTLFSIIVGLVIFFNLKVAELLSDFDLIKAKLIAAIIKLQNYIFSNFGISLENQRQVLKIEQLPFGNIMQTVLGSVAYIVSNVILILIYVLFLLYYRTHIKNFLLKFSTKDQQPQVLQLITKSTNISQQYLLGLSKMIVCLWIMYGIGFSIVGVENALVFAIICGVLEIVPYVGNFIGMSLTVVVAALHSAKLSLLGGIVITYASVQLIQGWLLEPLMLGPQVKINPLFTIIALVLGELLWGISGVIIAIPLTAIFKIFCDNLESLKPYGFLIGEIETVKKERLFIKNIKQKFKK